MWLMTFLNLTDIMSDIVIVGLQGRHKRYGHAMRRLTYPCNTSDRPLIVLDQKCTNLLPIFKKAVNRFEKEKVIMINVCAEILMI